MNAHHRKFLLCGALLAYVGLGTPAMAEVPLLQEGKRTLYQRVLTTPGCALHDGPAGKAGPVQPTFSRFYVYERKPGSGTSWIRVGPDASSGKTIGWLDQGCTVEWKMQLSLAFTNPAGRDRMIFFQDREQLDAVLDAIDPVEKIAPLRQQLQTTSSAPGVLAQEPELFVDMSKQFYLLPVLSGEEVMTEQGFRTRVLQVASVSEDRMLAAAPSGTPAAGAQATGATNTTAGTVNQLKEFSAAVVFVVDSTISMDPYIERTRQAVRKVYEQIEAENLSRQVKFGLVAFRSSTQAVPGLEYVSKTYADPNTVRDGADFMNKVAGLTQARVSSKLFDEDAYAGVMEAIGKIDWSPFGARYVVLITDAGAIDAENELSGTGLGADQVRLEAQNPGVAIYTLHLKTAAGAKNHGKAEAQYRNLSTYAGTNTSLYYPVNAGDVNEFGQKVDMLAAAITQQVKSAYLGEDAIGSAANARQTPAKPKDEREKMLEDAALIGHAMKLAYLGNRTGAKAPPVFKAWISDRDLIKQNVPTTDVRVLLTKGQLSDLSDAMRKILESATEGLISPTDMFNRLRDVAATMGADPNQLQQNGKASLSQMGLMAEYLEDLPYQSEVLNLDEDTWKSWDGLAQEKFIRTLDTKLRHYRLYNADADRWVSLAKGSDPSEHVYPVPLEMMP